MTAPAITIGAETHVSEAAPPDDRERDQAPSDRRRERQARRDRHPRRPRQGLRAAGRGDRARDPRRRSCNGTLWIDGKKLDVARRARPRDARRSAVEPRSDVELLPRFVQRVPGVDLRAVGGRPGVGRQQAASSTATRASRSLLARSESRHASAAAAADGTPVDGGEGSARGAQVAAAPASASGARRRSPSAARPSRRAEARRRQRAVGPPVHLARRPRPERRAPVRPRRAGARAPGRVPVDRSDERRRVRHDRARATARRRRPCA